MSPQQKPWQRFCLRPADVPEGGMYFVAVRNSAGEPEPLVLDIDRRLIQIAYPAYSNKQDVYRAAYVIQNILLVVLQKGMSEKDSALLDKSLGVVALPQREGRKFLTDSFYREIRTVSLEGLLSLVLDSIPPIPIRS